MALKGPEVTNAATGTFKASKRQADAVPGFRLAIPPTEGFKELGAMVNAAKTQRADTARLDADILHAVEIDGHVAGTDFHLSQAAFGDLCHWAGIPVAFIKRVAAQVNEDQALELIESCVARFFVPGPPKLLVVHAPTGRIEGIVGKETYAPLENVDALDYAMSAHPDLKLSNGWLSGPFMRVAATIDKDIPIIPALGDIVRMGITLENSIHGDQACRVVDYAERLCCTNGMTAKDNAHTSYVIHRGDVQFNVQKAVVASAQRAAFMEPIMTAAAKHFLTAEEIMGIRRFVADGRTGGNQTVESFMIQHAKKESAAEGRDENLPTLWNVVNGITQYEHMVESVQRKTEIEALGYQTLVKFGVQLVV